MEILAVLLVAYLVAAPDRVSLALSRGFAGAVRGAATGKTPNRKPSPRRRAMLAGWREGITSARSRREEGRDLWSRGSRVVGRAAGGTASLAKGIHSSIQARRDTAEPASDTSDAVPARRGWAIPALVKRPRRQPTSDQAADLVDQVDDEPAATVDPEPVSAPAPASDPIPGPERTPETPEPAPAAPEAPTGAATAATSPNGVTRMSLATTELSNIEDVKTELETTEAAMEDLITALDLVQKWAQNLPDRWEGAKWGTAGLDTAVSNIADVIGSLKMPDVMETFAAAKKEIRKARTVGEAADAAGARGNLDGFRAA